MRRRDQQGAALVETAFALPIFLALIGCVAFAGWLGVVQTIVSHGARAGARAAAIPSSQDLRSWPDETKVRSVVNASTPMLDPTSVHLVGSPGANNAAVRVEVTYTTISPVAVLMAPLRLFGIGNSIPTTITIRSSAEVRRE